MTSQDLYDFAPLARVLLTGAIIALGPVAWIWWRHRGATPLKRLQVLAVLTLFLSFDLVMFGAFTRLTDSGLGCPDWPGCYGNASPIGAHAEISAAQQAMPTGPVTHGKAWVEMIHRYLATAVGGLIIVLTASAWVRRRRQEHEPISPWWPTATLVWVLIQGAFGALTVTMKLFPAIVTLHLLGGTVLLMLLTVQATRQTQFADNLGLVPVPQVLRWVIAAAAALVFVQVTLGGWVSTNYAVLACTTFPQCNGAWWPAMNFDGFQIWRPLGFLADGSHISYEALVAIHYVHRLFAYLVIAALLWLGWRLHTVPQLASQRRWLIGLTVLQFATGLSNVVLDWPIVAAVLHTGGAAAIMVVLTWMWCSTHREIRRGEAAA
ncbi:COX15/CtaA family protein [Comamonas odontotermitis]|uniref:COX15/CtaA family protein n=1 Tax=Comamonas TaxID=283 RepID=UPI001CC41FF9|nr:COX15/CtaA family protein [Comamonas odontotermitis]UBB17819.1 COX15/CtaA family protein [Comamonas odontotermitis]